MKDRKLKWKREREKATDRLVVSHMSKKVNEHGKENAEWKVPCTVCSAFMALSHLSRRYIQWKNSDTL
jgi:hypothetical protein